MLDTNVRVATLKGMHHYIDLYRFWQHVQLEDESYDETFTIMQILVWLTLTEGWRSDRAKCLWWWSIICR